MEMNKNISVQNLMTSIIHHMNDESELEIETIVERVDHPQVDDESFINNIYRDGKKLVFVVYDYKKTDE